MRRFQVQRIEDESGVSGTGIVAQGIEFDNGKIAMQWLSHKPSITIFDNIKHLKDLHGHHGKTVVVWIDPDPLEDADVDEKTTENI